MTEDKIEGFRFTLKQRLEACQKKRSVLEGLGDLRNSLSLLVKELELRSILEIFAESFPEKIINFK